MVFTQQTSNNNNNVLPNWTKWTIWNPNLSTLLYKELLSRQKTNLCMSKENFGSFVTKLMKKISNEFEILPNDSFIMVKINDLDVPTTNDKFLYVDDGVYYSKVSYKMELNVQEIIFSNHKQLDIPITKIIAYDELAQILTTNIHSNDILLICNNYYALELDELIGQKLVLNKQKQVFARNAARNNNNNGKNIGSKAMDHKNIAEYLNVIHFPTNDFWKDEPPGNCLVEKIVPAKFQPNYYSFTYIGTGDTNILNSRACTYETKQIQKEYRKPKMFNIEEFFQETLSLKSRRCEKPFPIPITSTNPNSPYDVYHILFYSQSLFTSSPSPIEQNLQNNNTEKMQKQLYYYEETDDDDPDDVEEIDHDSSEPEEDSYSSGYKNKDCSTKTSSSLTSEKSFIQKKQFLEEITKKYPPSPVHTGRQFLNKRYSTCAKGQQQEQAVPAMPTRRSAQFAQYQTSSSSYYDSYYNQNKKKDKLIQFVMFGIICFVIILGILGIFNFDCIFEVLKGIFASVFNQEDDTNNGSRDGGSGLLNHN